MRRTRLFCSCALHACIVFLALQHPACGDEDAAQWPVISRSTWSQVKDSWQQLRTGAFAATGSLHLPVTGKTIDLQLSYAFDRPKKSWSNLASGFHGGSGTAFQLINSEYQLEWLESSAQKAGVYAVVDYEELSSSQRPLLTPYSMSVAAPSRAGRPFDAVLPELSAPATEDLIVHLEDINGIREIVYHGYGTTYCYCFDINNGCVPIATRVGRAAADNPREIVVPGYTIETEWQSLDGVMVPVLHRTRQFTQQELRSDQSLTLSWDFVNKDIPASRFTWQDAGLPEGVKVYDQRVDNGPLLGITGRALTLAETVTDIQRTGLQGRGPAGGKWLVLAATGAAVVAAFFWWNRRRRKRQSSAAEQNSPPQA